MAVIRKDDVTIVDAISGYPEPYNLGSGNLSYYPISDAGNLTQYGASLEILHPGGQSSQMHWESHEDEFLHMLSGELTVIEDSKETIIKPGDSCCWKAGDQIAHCLRNHTDAPATYLIVGTRHPENIAHYPGLDMLATSRGFTHSDGTPYPKKGEDK